MKTNIELPFAIGDRLYHVSFLNTDGAARLAVIEQYRHPVEGVMLDGHGTARPVIDGHPMDFNSTSAAPDKRSAVKALAAAHPGTLLLDGRSRRSVLYGDCMGRHYRTNMLATAACLTKHVRRPMLLKGPEEGTFLVQTSSGFKRGDDPVSAFQIGKDGRVEDVITGSFLYVRTRRRPDGLLELTDLADGPVPYIDPDSAPSDMRAACSPDYWTVASDMTVEDLCEYLQNNFPCDANVSICGLNDIVIHFSPYKNTVILDDKTQAELPEYQGREPVRVRGEGYDGEDDYDDLLEFEEEAGDD